MHDQVAERSHFGFQFEVVLIFREVLGHFEDLVIDALEVLAGALCRCCRLLRLRECGTRQQ